MEKERLYTKLECHVIDVEVQSVLCASGEFSTSSPFGDSTEEDW